jgi:hypothetical protein
MLLDLSKKYVFKLAAAFTIFAEKYGGGGFWRLFFSTALRMVNF